MLYELNIDTNYLPYVKRDLEDTSKFNLDSLKSINTDTFNNFILLIDSVKKLTPSDISPHINMIYPGIYETLFSLDIISDMAKIKIQKYNHFTYKSDFGIADNYEQIIQHYPEIINSNKKYFIVCNWLNKEDTGSEYFRYHKNGDYIGRLKPRGEYFKEDAHINKLLLFHIAEIIEENTTTEDYTDNWIELTRLIQHN